MFVYIRPRPSIPESSRTAAKIVKRANVAAVLMTPAVGRWSCCTLGFESESKVNCEILPHRSRPPPDSELRTPHIITQQAFDPPRPQMELGSMNHHFVIFLPAFSAQLPSRRRRMRIGETCGPVARRRLRATCTPTPPGHLTTI
ncbi:hypothetical protein Bbelb_296790 [Branchiostoma belcheri]|nr:hypothetical protein Bbelb_296790 [Branchiostoma belcheri]